MEPAKYTMEQAKAVCNGNRARNKQSQLRTIAAASSDYRCALCSKTSTPRFRQQHERSCVRLAWRSTATRGLPGLRDNGKKQSSTYQITKNSQWVHRFKRGSLRKFPHPRFLKLRLIFASVTKIFFLVAGGRGPNRGWVIKLFAEFNLRIALVPSRSHT